jgi:hypothetical protein
MWTSMFGYLLFMQPRSVTRAYHNNRPEPRVHIAQWLLPTHDSSVLYCTVVYNIPDNDDHMIYEMCKACRICLDWDPYDRTMYLEMQKAMP